MASVPGDQPELAKNPLSGHLGGPVTPEPAQLHPQMRMTRKRPPRPVSSSSSLSSEPTDPPRVIITLDEDGKEVGGVDGVGPIEFEVEEILARERRRVRCPDGRVSRPWFYHVEWLGYPTMENSWEPASNVICPAKICEWWLR